MPGLTPTAVSLGGSQAAPTLVPYWAVTGHMRTGSSPSWTQMAGCAEGYARLLPPGVGAGARLCTSTCC